MAGSRRSPVLRDEWRGDAGSHRGRDKHRPRGSHRDRGRDRFRDRDRRNRPKDARPDHLSRSPPPRSFPGPDNEPQHRDFSPNIAPIRGSSLPESHPSNDKPHRFHSPETTDHPGPDSHSRTGNYHREDSPSEPPSKRKRTRSPSPGHFQSHPPHSHRGAPSRQGDDFASYRGRRGRIAGRGRPNRRPSPRRGRDRRKSDGGRRDLSRPRHSRSPGWEGKPYIHPSRRTHSPHPEDEIEDRSYHRSPSHHSANTLDSRPSAFSRRGSRGDHTMYPPRPHPEVDDSLRSPSPSRPISNRDADSTSVHGDAGRFDAKRQRSPRSPATSYHGSARSNSPYSAARGGQSRQQPQRHAQLPLGPSSHYAVSSHSYRDEQSRFHEPQQGRATDRRPSASGLTGPSAHDGGRSSSPRWDASESRSRADPPSPPPRGPPAESPPPLPPLPPTEPRAHRGLYQSAFNRRPGDENTKHELDNGNGLAVQPDTRPPDMSSTPNKGGKISFAFKAKSGPPSAPKPVPDLAQRMLARDPPPRVAEPPRNRMSNGPPPKFKPDPRFDRRDRDRDRHRDRDRNRGGRNDRRDYRDSRGYREPPREPPREPREPHREPPREPRDHRRDDRRFDYRPDKRRNDRAQDARPLRHQEPSLEPIKRPKIMLRPKPRPTISEEFTKSDSVYYRKPGNESVIGAGTYGKVFKAIHVYTQRKVALKKIRMEGEKDGFPVTAVREIKLLQHLRNHNVVSLLEVMVEKNECFMVFEYLSHDLTGLINHPTFTLTAAHKKDLAKQMFEGLHYLHHRGVLHRDIKAANILISNQGRLKYADFGLARFFSKSRQLDYTNRVITIWYRPPELLLGETRYGPAVDVWSAACVYVEMFTKKAVFPGEGGEISQLDKLYTTLGTPIRTEWPDIIEMPWFELMRPTERRKRIFENVYRDTLSPSALDMISQIFRYDPSKRPTAEDVLAHPYFHSEEPSPQQPTELESIEGDWHEFESKALRKERDREARRVEYQKDKEKRKTVPSAHDEREPKRIRQDTSEGLTPTMQPAEE
ncbi:hypothetical protein BDW59DRAFT_69016 [Aspergillus cavernicola]|uniref:cyclin-dependent kinase n=1 Tax=Aspergillus cavernicola TaxID=176166 RepID=A0ABR4IE10_9EURO